MSGKIHHSIEELVGNTPLVELDNYEKQEGLNAHILAKVEYFNPIGSVKDRIAIGMINDAEQKGLITPGKTTLIETTSGNTGIALAAFAAAKGYKIRIYIQDDVSIERKQVIKAFGAQLINLSEVPAMNKVLEETGGDFVAAIAALRTEVLSKEKDIYFLDQTANPANPASHVRTTGEEIWRDTDGKVDVFIACVGTGGTLSGVGKVLKEKGSKARIVGVQAKLDQIEITGVHPFTGIPVERIPATLDQKIYDDAVTVDKDDAYAAARKVAKSDGLLVGISSGAALHVATEYAKKPENKGKNIVVILPDTGLRYLTTPLFEV